MQFVIGGQIFGTDASSAVADLRFGGDFGRRGRGVHYMLHQILVEAVLFALCHGGFRGDGFIRGR